MEQKKKINADPELSVVAQHHETQPLVRIKEKLVLSDK